MGFFFWLPVLLIISLCFIQGRDISLSNGQLLGLITDLAVLGIVCLAAGKNLGVLSGEFFDFWDFPDAKLIKCLLGGFVDCELFPVGFKELFAVAGFPVRFIGAAGLGIVDDVLLKCRDLREPFLRSLDRSKKGVPFSCSFRCG